MANKILTVSELAEHLNVHRITIYRLLKSGSLPGFKIGRVWRFDLDEIGLWMADGKSAEAMKAAGDGHLDGHHLDGHRVDGTHDGRSVDSHDGRPPSAGTPRKPPPPLLRGRGPKPKR
jgi:excisionase family DNA binding protein